MLRLAIAQIRPVKGEYATNVARIGGVLAQECGAVLSRFFESRR